MVAFLDYPPECEFIFTSSLPPICHYIFTETHQRKRATKTGKSTQVSEDGGFFFLTVLLLACLSARNLLAPFIRELVESVKVQLSHNFDETPESCFMPQIQFAGQRVLISFRVGKRALREAHGNLSSMLGE